MNDLISSPFPHFSLLSLATWSGADIQRVFDLAKAMKADPEGHKQLLAGKRLALI